jgi:hypothetical protein
MIGPREPMVMAFVQYSDEEFLSGVGATREEAYAAMFEAPDIHPSHLTREVSYLLLTPRPSGWSTDTGQNLG